LTYRDEKQYIAGSWTGFREDFSYDEVNRLSTVSRGGNQTMLMTYKAGVNDRIGSKSDVGSYIYQTNNHRLQNINQSLGLPDHDLTYTATGKVATITESGSTPKLLTLEYGVDD
jgi:hypothetical protein